MRILQLAMLAVIACGMTACGNKGKLKSPTQMEEAQAKKRAKMERQENSEAEPEDLTVLPEDAIKPAPPEPKQPLYGVPASPFDGGDKD